MSCFYINGLALCQHRTIASGKVSAFGNTYSIDLQQLDATDCAACEIRRNVMKANGIILFSDYNHIMNYPRWLERLLVAELIGELRCNSIAIESDDELAKANALVFNAAYSNNGIKFLNVLVSAVKAERDIRLLKGYSLTDGLRSTTRHTSSETIRSLQRRNKR